MQTQIRLLRAYTVCHSVCIVWTPYSMVEPHSSNFRVMTTNFLGVRIFRKFTVYILYGPRQANLLLIAYASSEGSGEPAHPRSLARTFAARSYKQWVKRNLQTESQIRGPSKWLGMRGWNLSWRNARRHKFAWRGSYRHNISWAKFPNDWHVSDIQIQTLLCALCFILHSVAMTNRNNVPLYLIKREL